MTTKCNGMTFKSILDFLKVIKNIFNWANFNIDYTVY